MSSDVKTIVVDNGSRYIKAGLAGDIIPKEFECIVGRPTDASCPASHYCAGEITPEILPQLMVSSPIRHGIIQDWEDMRRLWSHVFASMGVDPRDAQVMLTDSISAPPRHRQKMLEIMFEYFNVSRAAIQVQSILTLYSQGLLSGLVLDCGYSMCHAIPVLDGYFSQHLVKHLNGGGCHIESHLTTLLQRRGYFLNNRGNDVHIAQNIKEKHCYVAVDYASEVKLAKETVCLSQTYTLPDGKTIRIGAERFMAPEVLFYPKLLGEEGLGLGEVANSCIQGCPIDHRRQLYQTIVLTGGTTMLPGFANRIEVELERCLVEKVVLKGKPTMVRVVYPPHRKYGAFVGAAALAEISQSTKDFWISRDEWMEDPTRASTSLEGRGGHSARGWSAALGANNPDGST